MIKCQDQDQVPSINVDAAARRSTAALGARATMIEARHMGGIFIGLFLTGCCAFAPCHPGSDVSGRVVSSLGTPVVGAAISLYSRSTTADASGCFKLGGPDALPFELLVSALGFKTLHVASGRGQYYLTVTLVPTEGDAQSTVEWSRSKPTAVGVRACT